MAALSTLWLRSSDLEARFWLEKYGSDVPPAFPAFSSGVPYVGMGKKGDYWGSDDGIEDAVRIGPPVVPALLGLLRSPHDWQRKRAHIALERIRYPQLPARGITAQEELLLSDYDPFEPNSARREASAKKWDEWWEEMKK